MPEQAYLGAAQIGSLVRRLELRPTKKLGQNFVTDANTVRRIVRDAGVQSGEVVLEVGPGLGSLTVGLLSAGAKVIAIEIDETLAKQLPKTVSELLPEADLEVVLADALTVTTLPAEPTSLVANLPYNVSVPIILHLLQTFPSIDRALVMVQSEVGKRIASAPGSKVYGAPSAKSAWYGAWREVGPVSRQVFWPVPNVDSILVSFQRSAQELGTEAERERTFELIDGAFQQRRKMLRQALIGELGTDTVAVLERAGIDPTSRGEQLGVGDFLAIARID
ncbi:MAG: 16S rRNA (adenine(1518)-N(6)/adenine(1519)-N(6))-dimethyltransferase RsmA [Cryobacterium sp.]|nr:16S rRNA (adenine(1518)-N(6)/adenine(1519)-N(6))-dimethyltransferase RsmA [Cryobacterium sp.]